jgi:hypothetical protein
MKPNFVLMKLSDESGLEFVEVLPFTPANRNNLIGWIAGRSDGTHNGTSVVYNFPKTAGSWEWRGPDDTFDEYFRKAGFDLFNSRIDCFLGLCYASWIYPVIWDSTQAVWLSAMALSIQLSRSNQLLCRVGLLFSGTKTTAPILALSKLIFWVWV